MNATPWNLWIMRNCAECIVSPCATYDRQYSQAKEGTWNENTPNCKEKIKMTEEEQAWAGTR